MADDAELLGRIHKLHEIYQVLVPGGGDLHLPTAWKAVRNLEASTRDFVATLLKALMVWIEPLDTISEEDFIRRLVRQMVNSEKAQHKKTVREFLVRMEAREQVKTKTLCSMEQQHMAEAQRECTFQPPTHKDAEGRLAPLPLEERLPKTTQPGVSDLRKHFPFSADAMYPECRRKPAEPPKPVDPSSWVARLYPAPVDQHMQHLDPAAKAGVNALRGLEAGMYDAYGKELQPVTGQRLEAAALTQWVAGLRADEPRPGPVGGGRYKSNWESHEQSVSSRGSAGDDIEVTPSGRRRKIYASGAQGSVDSAYSHGCKPPKGSNVNNMATAVGVPVYKWKDRLRGGYLASKLDMSPIALATRQRLYECTVRSFKEYHGPPSEYSPPYPYDEYTPVPEPNTRHGIMHGVQ